MAGPTIVIFHRPAGPHDAPLVRLLADVRARLAADQADAFVAAGAGDIRWVDEVADSFGQILAAAVPDRDGVVVFGSGAVPLLKPADAAQLLAVATAGGRRALTNNRYSSDNCAISNASVLTQLPALPSDNALPRWLEERSGFSVEELTGRDRLALDLDTPLDIALVALSPAAPAWLRRAATEAGLAVPRRSELLSLSADPHRELLVFGRAGSSTLRWLERNVRCRVRFLAEERGLRASSPLAIGTPAPVHSRPPRATIGRLLARRGPAALPDVVAELADGAIIDSRVLMADHYGPDEAAWPAPADRYASDLLRAEEVADPWLRELTTAAAASRRPIVLGAHTLIGPGIRWLLGTGAPPLKDPA